MELLELREHTSAGRVDEQIAGVVADPAPAVSPGVSARAAHDALMRQARGEA